MNSLVGKGKGGNMWNMVKSKTNWGDNWKGKGSKGAHGKAKETSDGASKHMKGECWTRGQTGHHWFLCQHDPNTAQAHAQAA